MPRGMSAWRVVRNFGLGWLWGTLVLARFTPRWQACALCALLVVGIGIGIDDWKGGEE